MDDISNFLPLIAALAGLGGCAGFLAGLLGVGGGIVLVPGLYYIFVHAQPDFGYDTEHIMHMALGTSLAAIVPTGLSSATAHYRNEAVDFTLVTRIGFGIVFGVIFATVVAKGLDGIVLRQFFVKALFVLAGIMAFNPARLKLALSVPKQPLSSIAGFIIGTVSTLIGIGGATLSVPYMIFHNIPMHRAVGTASALGLVISIPAALGFMLIGTGVGHLPPFSIGYVNVMAWVVIIPVSVAVAPLGAYVAHKIDQNILRKVFALFMVVVALKMLHQIRGW